MIERPGATGRLEESPVELALSRALTQLSGDAADTIVDGLTDVLRTEWRLLDELREVLDGQAAALESASAESMTECVYAAHRLLLTLGEARKWRATIARWLGLGEKLTVPELVEALGPAATLSLRAASESVRASAEALSVAVRENGYVLRIAARHHRID